MTQLPTIPDSNSLKETSEGSKSETSEDSETLEDPETSERSETLERSETSERSETLERSETSETPKQENQENPKKQETINYENSKEVLKDEIAYIKELCGNKSLAETVLELAKTNAGHINVQHFLHFITSRLDKHEMASENKNLEIIKLRTENERINNEIRNIFISLFADVKK